jgi:hypothetical protein
MRTKFAYVTQRIVSMFQSSEIRSNGKVIDQTVRTEELVAIIVFRSDRKSLPKFVGEIVSITS